MALQGWYLLQKYIFFRKWIIQNLSFITRCLFFENDFFVLFYLHEFFCGTLVSTQWEINNKPYIEVSQNFCQIKGLIQLK